MLIENPFVFFLTEQNKIHYLVIFGVYKKNLINIEINLGY